MRFAENVILKQRVEREEEKIVCKTDRRQRGFAPRFFFFFFEFFFEFFREESLKKRVKEAREVAKRRRE